MQHTLLSVMHRGITQWFPYNLHTPNFKWHSLSLLFNVMFTMVLISLKHLWLYDLPNITLLYTCTCMIAPPFPFYKGLVISVWSHRAVDYKDFVTQTLNRVLGPCGCSCTHQHSNFLQRGRLEQLILDLDRIKISKQWAMTLYNKRTTMPYLHSSPVAEPWKTLDTAFLNCFIFIFLRSWRSSSVFHKMVLSFLFWPFHSDPCTEAQWTQWRHFVWVKCY